MNLFKKSTATVALVALLSGVFSAGVSASSSTEIEAANALADNGVITDHSDDTAAYNLNQNVLRQEIAAVARGIAGLDKKTTCDESFTDVTATTPNDWACYSVEALLDADLIASNTMFKPEMEISKAEAVGMMVKAAFGDEYAYDAGLATSWMEQVVAFAVDKGVVKNFTNYDTAATRGFVFEAGNEAMMASEEVVEECDEVSQLLGLCDEVADDNGDDEGGDDVVVISGDNLLMAELSATTAAGTDLPLAANGVNVLSFDVTAGSEDVSITAMELERTGFGESAADEVAVYSEEWRASKVKSFSDSDDTANLTFSPAVVIKAGETRTLTAKVNTHASNLGEFAVSVTNITASSTVDAATIVSNYFDVKNVAASELTIDDEGVNVSVKAGEEQAELAEFKLTNEGNLTTDADITVTSITLKEIGSVDQEDVLENLTLTVNGEVISTVASIEDKYLTFNFDPFVIEDDKNETFTVKADVMGWAGDDVQFVLDNKIDITATSSKYNAVNIVTGVALASTVDIDAGELTLYAIDAEADEIRQDKSNVVIGQLKIVNVAGQNLELQNLGVVLTTTNSWVLEILENVEFEVNGTSYDLDAPDGTLASASPVTFSESDLGIILAQGTSILTVRADTLDNLTDGTTVTMTLDAGTTSTFRVEETEDDVLVDDVTPSSLSWDNVEVVLSAATVSNVPLANVEIVKGATDLVALQFEIEADSASYVTVDKIKVALNEDTTAGTGITKDSVSQVSLYRGSVSESNLLDQESGSKLDVNGVATLEFTEVEIAADATETFIVTVSTVDTTDVVGKVIVASVASADIDVEDDENDAVTLNGPATLNDKLITVKDSGQLVITADANNVDNEDSKTILGWEEMIVYSADAIATNEEVNVETVEFTLDANLKKVVASAKLYLDDVVVATATNSDVSDVANSVITFDNISNLDFPTVESELKLAIVTETIGYEKVGEAVLDVAVTEVALTEAEGVDSSETVVVDVTDVDTAPETDSELFSVVPAVVVASVDQKLETGSVKVTVTVDTGDNTATGSAASPVVTIQGLGVIDLVTSTGVVNFNIFEEGESTGLTEGSFGVVVSGSQTFDLIPTDTTAVTYTLRLPTDGVTYDAAASTGLTSNLSTELDLGTKTYE